MENNKENVLFDVFQFWIKKNKEHNMGARIMLRDGIMSFEFMNHVDYSSFLGLLRAEQSVGECPLVESLDKDRFYIEFKKIYKIEESVIASWYELLRKKDTDDEVKRVLARNKPKPKKPKDSNPPTETPLPIVLSRPEKLELLNKFLSQTKNVVMEDKGGTGIFIFSTKETESATTEAVHKKIRKFLLEKGILYSVLDSSTGIKFWVR